ncbi:RNA-binding S4 domain-containing protein [Cucumibacter marinus]|uniref:RNA-binding S4 domain-containing protein n=1 Tax=Cucumibacter marinus TaxID=1121252 RepID=UPI000418CAE0|nr:RNA-binding S4 domain-containing protein [Cucumibacter marinus]
MTAPAQRLDKWLWFARCGRTRGAAQRLIGEGHVRINGTKTTSNAASVRPGDVLTITIGRGLRIWKVLDIAERREGADKASLLYEDMSPELPRDPKPATAFEQAIRPQGAGRPTKRDRRRIDAIKPSD